MSETASTTTENAEETGIEKMSLSDAINFSANGVKPSATKEEAHVEEAKEEVIVDETEKSKEVEKPAEQVVETKVDDIKTETVAKEEKPIETKTEAPKSSFEDLMDEEDKAYFNFKKNNPGTTRADYQESKVDYDALDRKDLLRKSLREKYNLNDDDATLDEFIETELGIPMDVKESEMSLTERVKLRKETDPYVEAKKAQQQKWKESKVEENVAQQKEEVEMLTLEDGTKMPKAQYEKIVENRNNYLKNNEEALNRVSATYFKFEVDDNGSKRELEYGYTFDKEDKHRMLSNTNDVVAHFNKTYTTEKGYDHDRLNEDLAWADPQTRNKMLKSLLASARAEAFEESLKDRGNVTIGQQKELSKNETKGIRYVPFSELLTK